MLRSLSPSRGPECDDLFSIENDGCGLYYSAPGSCFGRRATITQPTSPARSPLTGAGPNRPRREKVRVNGLFYGRELKLGEPDKPMGSI